MGGISSAIALLLLSLPDGSAADASTAARHIHLGRDAKKQHDPPGRDELGSDLRTHMHHTRA